jgi:hypothetical protein
VTSEDQLAAFRLTQFELDHAHELELERASVHYEVGFLQAIFFLNGGSATVFVSMVGSQFEQLYSTHPIALVYALFFWIAGLLVALVAGFCAYEAQKTFIGEIRARRHISALRICSDPEKVGLKPGESVEYFREQVRARRLKGGAQWNEAVKIGGVSVVCFTIGVICAARAVIP